MGRLPGQTAPAIANPQLGFKETFPVHLQKVKNFARTWKTPLSVVAGLGVSAFVIVTDWKVLVSKIPVYGKQFKVEDE